jgi:LysM repeat protein
MQRAGSVLGGIAIALVSLALVAGAFSISLAEDEMQVTIPAMTFFFPAGPTQTAGVLQSPTPLISTLPPTPSVTETIAATVSITPSSTSTACTVPAGWSVHAAQAGENLENLAAKYKTSQAAIIQANCLPSAILVSGQLLYLPPMPVTSSRTPVRCGPPASWINYIVQPGDTLYHLGQVYGIPYTEIQKANCLSGTTITVGQHLFVPPWAPRTPTPEYPVLPPIFIPTDTPVESPTVDTPTETGTPTLEEAFTPTFTASP